MADASGSGMAGDIGNLRDMAALVASRICHDLISPLGAIGNGVELLAMASAPRGPEAALIDDSLTSATARIRLFRLAFGSAAPGARVAPGEFEATLAGIGAGGRLAIDWRGGGPMEGEVARLLLLCLMCLESAMPRGGRLRLVPQAAGWRIEAEAPVLRPLPGQWSVFDGAAPAAGMEPAEVQFALAPTAAAAMGWRLARTETATGMVVMLSPG